MSASMNANPDLTVLRQDLLALKRDVAKAVEHIKSGAANNVWSAADQIDRSARGFREAAAAEGERSAQTVGFFIEEQPFVALIIAVGLGYIGARVLRQ